MAHEKWIESILKQMKEIKIGLKGYKYLDEAIELATELGLSINEAEIIRTNSTGLVIYNPKNLADRIKGMKNKEKTQEVALAVNPAEGPYRERRRGKERRQNGQARFKYFLINGRREVARREEDKTRYYFFDRYNQRMFAAITAISLFPTRSCDCGHNSIGTNFPHAVVVGVTYI